MGTMRLTIVFGGGLIGVMYLAVTLTPLVTGRYEIKPTTVSIDDVEAAGFPEAAYLEVTGGVAVFSEANVWLTSKKRGEMLFILTVPVVSKTLWEKWRTSLEKGEALEASQFRLAVAIKGEEVARLWPEVKTRAEAKQPLDLPPAPLTAIGETEPAPRQPGQPLQSDIRKTGLDWEKARWLRYKKHHHSLGRLLKNLAIAAGLLFLAVVVFRHHRRRPDDVTVNALDITPLFDD